MSPQPPPSGRPPPQFPVQGHPRPTNEEVNEYLLSLIGGDLPGEGFLFPDGSPGDPRAAPSVDDTRTELLRAIRVMGFALQLPYGEDKKADLGHALLACSQSYLLLDPSVDEEGVSVEGRAEADAKAAQKFPPRVEPNAAEKNLDEKTKDKQESLKHDRGQTPTPRPRVGQ